MFGMSQQQQVALIQQMAQLQLMNGMQQQQQQQSKPNSKLFLFDSSLYTVVQSLPQFRHNHKISVLIFGLDTYSHAWLIRFTKLMSHVRRI